MHYEGQPPRGKKSPGWCVFVHPSYGCEWTRTGESTISSSCCIPGPLCLITVAYNVKISGKVGTSDCQVIGKAGRSMEIQDGFKEIKELPLSWLRMTIKMVAGDRRSVESRLVNRPC